MNNGEESGAEGSDVEANFNEAGSGIQEQKSIKDQAAQKKTEEEIRRELEEKITEEIKKRIIKETREQMEKEIKDIKEKHKEIKQFNTMKEEASRPVNVLKAFLEMDWKALLEEKEPLENFLTENKEFLKEKGLLKKRKSSPMESIIDACKKKYKEGEKFHQNNLLLNSKDAAFQGSIVPKEEDDLLEQNPFEQDNFSLFYPKDTKEKKIPPQTSPKNFAPSRGIPGSNFPPSWYSHKNKLELNLDEDVNGGLPPFGKNSDLKGPDFSNKPFPAPSPTEYKDLKKENDPLFLCMKEALSDYDKNRYFILSANMPDLEEELIEKYPWTKGIDWHDILKFLHGIYYSEGPKATTNPVRPKTGLDLQQHLLAINELLKYKKNPVSQEAWGPLLKTFEQLNNIPFSLKFCFDEKTRRIGLSLENSKLGLEYLFINQDNKIKTLTWAVPEYLGLIEENSKKDFTSKEFLNHELPKSQGQVKNHLETLKNIFLENLQRANDNKKYFGGRKVFEDLKQLNKELYATGSPYLLKLKPETYDHMSSTTMELGGKSFEDLAEAFEQIPVGGDGLCLIRSLMVAFLGSIFPSVGPNDTYRTGFYAKAFCDKKALVFTMYDLVLQADRMMRKKNLIPPEFIKTVTNVFYSHATLIGDASRKKIKAILEDQFKNLLENELKSKGGFLEWKKLFGNKDLKENINLKKLEKEIADYLKTEVPAGKNSNFLTGEFNDAWVQSLQYKLNTDSSEDTRYEFMCMRREGNLLIEIFKYLRNAYADNSEGFQNLSTFDRVFWRRVLKNDWCVREEGKFSDGKPFIYINGENTHFSVYAPLNHNLLTLKLGWELEDSTIAESDPIPLLGFMITAFNNFSDPTKVKLFNEYTTYKNILKGIFQNEEFKGSGSNSKKTAFVTDLVNKILEYKESVFFDVKNKKDYIIEQEECDIIFKNSKGTKRFKSE